MGTSRKGIGGPKTPEGKLRVSLNAMKTGLYASSEQAIEVLARRIARLAWRTRLTEAIETRNLMRCPERPHIGPHYERIIRSERVMDVQFHRAVFALERKRRPRI